MDQDTPPSAEGTAPIEDLLDVLDLTPLGTSTITVRGAGSDDGPPAGTSVAMEFVGRSQPQPFGRVFGGQVLAQSVIAAGRTVEALPSHAVSPRRLHSLHAYFIRPGDDSLPIRFEVEVMRDGHSFSTRRVHALQHGAPILSMIASFQTQDEGVDHQDTMPSAPDPESLPTLAEQLAGIDHPTTRHLSSRRPIDVRHCDVPIYLTPAPERVDHQMVWMRAVGELPDDPLLHQAVLAYASDYSLLEPVLRLHGIAWSDRRLRPASLDHAMWFHRPVRADEWTLYTQSSPSASGGRGLGAGRMFSRDGRLMASVAQEGMVRLKRG